MYTAMQLLVLLPTCLKYNTTN